MMFPTLYKALQQNADYVVAEDLSNDGRKQFYSGTLEHLKRLYDTKAHHYWYECLMEDRPSRLFLDVDATTNVDIHEIVHNLRTAILAMLESKSIPIEPDIHIMDSSGDSKYSWHILVTNVVLKNVYHVGAFVRRLLLFYADAPTMQTIDSAVYTRNRMFRLPGSSKFGSQRVLRSEQPWYEMMVQIPCASPIECLEIDGSVPESTSSPPLALFREQEDGSWSRLGRKYTAGNSSNCTTRLIAPVLDWLDHHEHAETLRHKVKFVSSGHYIVPAKSRKCYIAGRTHKGNAIWYKLDLTKRQIRQRCLDSDCARRSHLIPCPDNIWDRWVGGWAAVEPRPNNQKTLYNMSY